MNLYCVTYGQVLHSIFLLGERHEANVYITSLILYLIRYILPLFYLIFNISYLGDMMISTIDTKKAQLTEAEKYVDFISPGGLPHPNECPTYDIKLSDGETQAVELLGMWSASS